MQNWMQKCIFRIHSTVMAIEIIMYYRIKIKVKCDHLEKMISWGNIRSSHEKIDFKVDKRWKFLNQILTTSLIFQHTVTQNIFQQFFPPDTKSRWFTRWAENQSNINCNRLIKKKKINFPRWNLILSTTWKPYDSSSSQTINIFACGKQINFQTEAILNCPRRAFTAQSWYLGVSKTRGKNLIYFLNLFIIIATENDFQNNHNFYVFYGESTINPQQIFIRRNFQISMVQNFRKIWDTNCIEFRKMQSSRKIFIISTERCSKKI